MRTTVTLDPDAEQIVRRRMREHGVSFKQALNDSIRAHTSADDVRRTPFRTATTAMGRPAIDLDRALQIAAELEDDELMARVRAGS
ncbi:MAG: antitoxin [Actinomycetota bacterium]